MSVESEILRIQHNIADAYTKVAEKGGEVPLQPNSVNLAAAVETIPSSGDLIAGDGMSKEGNTLSVTTPVRSIVTQSEFDALTEERKNKGLYVISDGDGSGSGGGSSEEVYSTEETRIGTWIDGKPLYRRVWELTSSTSNSGAPILTLPAEILYVTRIDGTIHTSKINATVPVNFYLGGSVLIATFIWGNVIYSAVETNYQSQPLNLILEYTKTTDEGGTT